MDNLGKYNKFWLALAGAIITVAVDYFSPSAEWLSQLIPFLTAIGVYNVRNDLGGSSRKR